MKRKINFAFFIVYVFMVLLERVFLREQETLLLTLHNEDKTRVTDPLIKANIPYRISGDCLYVKRKNKDDALYAYYNSLSHINDVVTV